MYEIQRPYNELGTQRHVGEVITGDGYRLLSNLISNRYLKPLDKDFIPCTCELCSMMFVDQQMLEEHYIKHHPDQIEITEDEVVNTEIIPEVNSNSSGADGKDIEGSGVNEQTNKGNSKGSRNVTR